MHVRDHRPRRRTGSKPAPARRALTTMAVALMMLVVTGCNAVAVGRNVDGRLGIGSTVDQATPVTLGGGLEFSVLDGGDTHTCGITTASALYCWGSNLNNQLGTDAGVLSQLTPLRIGTHDDWTAVSAGGSHTCGIRDFGHLYCWGSNQFRQVNVRHGLPHVREPTQVGTSIRWIAISAGQQHTCGLQEYPDGVRLHCWGQSSDGRLGNGETTGSGSDVLPIGTHTDWTDVDAGQHSCGVRGGQLFCWGGNDDGQLGTGDRSPRSTPARVGPDTGWVEAAAGERHSCGRGNDTAVRCWGRNANGQIGDGSFVDRLLPVVVHGGNGWTALSVGGTHSCGIRAERAWCWGSNAFGSLGDGTKTDRGIPVQVAGVDGPVTDVVAGRHHTLISR